MKPTEPHDHGALCIECRRPIEDGLDRYGAVHCHDCKRPGTVRHTLSGR